MLDEAWGIRQVFAALPHPWQQGIASRADRLSRATLTPVQAAVRRPQVFRGAEAEWACRPKAKLANSLHQIVLPAIAVQVS